MAVRRTKSQKQKAQINRVGGLSYEYHPTEAIEKKETVAPTSLDEKQIKKLMISEPKDVFKDLVKTFVVTLIVIAILFTIFFVQK